MRRSDDEKYTYKPTVSRDPISGEKKYAVIRVRKDPQEPRQSREEARRHLRRASRDCGC